MSEHFIIEKYGLYFGVYENTNEGKVLVCVCTYKKGAVEVARRLNDLFSKVA